MVINHTFGCTVQCSFWTWFQLKWKRKLNVQCNAVKFVPFHANFADIKSSICTTCSYLALYLCQWNNGDLFFRLWVQFPPWGLFLLSPDLLFGPIAGAAISFMSSHCRGSKPSNFAILWVFVTLKHVPKSAFQKKWITVWLLTTDYFSGPKSLLWNRTLVRVFFCPSVVAVL